jgi:hypothetical protein
MANDHNLIPPVKGEIRNPKGKQKGRKNIKTIIKKYLEQEIKHNNPFTKTEEYLTIEEHIMLTALAKAINGDDRAREDVLNRLYGKPKETIENNMKGKINIEIDYV